MIIEGARVVTCAGRDADRATASWIRIAGGRIAEVGEGAAPSDDVERRDLRGRWVGPGFIDIHVHGGFGADVMDGRAEDIAIIAGGLVRHGVTSFVPTTYTASIEQTLRALAAIQGARTAQRRRPGAPTAEILGANMEGPFLNPLRKGAHPESELRDGSPGLVDDFCAQTRVLVMTVAPERDGGRELIAELRRRGILVSIGHSDADQLTVTEAVASGARAVTHLFNGMRPLHHREVGLTGAALLDPALLCELIADGVHVSPAAIRIAWLMKGAHGLMLVSDGGRHAGEGLPAQEATRLADGTLASSACMLDAGFRMLRDASGASIPKIWPSASTNAADALGLGRKGRIVPGADADLVVLDEDANVVGTFVAGEPAHGIPAC